MAIVISGVNNNDKITASDGTIDLLSGVNFTTEITAHSFKVGDDIQFGNAGIATAANFKTGVSNLHSLGLTLSGGQLDVGSHIKLGHAGIVTATTFVGNVTGNINNSTLLLQTGGTERARITSGGTLAINKSSGNFGSPLHIIADANENAITVEGLKAAINWRYTDGSANRRGGIKWDGNSGQVLFDSGVSGNGYYYQFDLNGSERLRIDSSGRVLIGQTSSINGIFGSPPPRFSVSTTTASPAIFATYSSDSYASRIDLLKSRNATVGSHTVVQNGDGLGEIYFGGSDGDQFHGGALIQAVVESGVGNDDMPANLRFYTNGGATTVTERLRITSSGNVGVNVTDPDQKLEVDGIIKGSSYFQAGASGTASNNWHFGAEGNGEFRVYSGNYGAGDEKVRITSAGVVETYGGSGAAALRVKNGGDMEFYAANNSSKVTLHCDTNLQLTIGDKLRFANTSGGILRSNGQHALKPTGACIQTKVTYRGSKFTNSSTSYQVVHSHDFNGIESGNRIGIHLDCDMNADTGGSSWQMMGLRIGSTMYSEKIIEHSAGMNMNASANGLTGAMSAGNHAVQFITRNGGGQCSYNEGNNATGIVLHTYEYVS